MAHEVVNLIYSIYILVGYVDFVTFDMYGSAPYDLYFLHFAIGEVFDMEVHMEYALG
jgi:hypothetical protein